MSRELSESEVRDFYKLGTRVQFMGPDGQTLFGRVVHMTPGGRLCVELASGRLFEVSTIHDQVKCDPIT